MPSDPVESPYPEPLIHLAPVIADASTATFFEATRAGQFLLRRRRSTGEYLDPRTVSTPSEEADLEWKPASGQARIVSWAVVHGIAGPDGSPTRTVIGVVELKEGPWWWCRLVGVDPDADLGGLAVQVGFVASGAEGENEIVPVFGTNRAAQATMTVGGDTP